MSRWFRHYAGMMRDDKLVRVALKSKQPVERVVWVWGAILESASEIDDGGRYDVDAAEVAYFLRADQPDIDAIFDGLASLDRIANGSVVNWGDRQFSSDRSKERVAAYRERKRAKGSGNKDSGGVTVTTCNADVTAQETETETEVISSNEDRPSGDGLTVEHVFEFYQETAIALSLAVPRDITPERRQLIKARIAQYPLADFQTVFARCRGSPFLRGDRGRTPLAIDWLMKKGNFQKVLEGNYDR